MRTLSSTLEAAQKSSAKTPLVKAVVGTHTYYFPGRIRHYEHDEQPHAERLTIVLDNHDKALNDVNLRGDKVVLSNGFKTSAGNEYSAKSPLYVMSQSFNSEPGSLTCTLTCAGVVNELAEDRASERYVDDDPEGVTIQAILNGILGGTLAPFDHCDAYTTSYDGDLDGLINTVKPGDSFRLYRGGSRMAAIRRLLDFTYCVMRPEADEKLHIFKPTTSGSTYDYEYALNAHIFYQKKQSNTITMPNHIVVSDKFDPDDPATYTGEATDDDSIAAYKTVKYFERVEGLTSNDQATSIAEAILSKFQMHNVQAGAAVPINVGAEIYDYVKITDSREGTSVTGNVGYIRTVFDAKKAQFTQAIGLGGWLSTRRRMTEEEIGGLPGEGSDPGYFSELVVDTLYLTPITIDDIEDGSSYQRVQTASLSAEGLVLLDQVVDGTYERVLATQLSANKLHLSDQCSYASGYDPTGKYDLEANDLDDLSDGALWSRVATTDIQSGHIKLSTVIQSSSYRTVSDGEKSTWTNKPDNMDEIGEGTTYQRVRATDISSGHIKLTSSTVVVGQWYSESGVIIDAETGIHIISGGNGALRLETGIDPSPLRFEVSGNIFGDLNYHTNGDLILTNYWAAKPIKVQFRDGIGDYFGIIMSGSSGLKVYPSVGTQMDFGSTLYYWQKLYTKYIDVASSGQIIGPAGSGSRHGTATYYPEETHSDNFVTHCRIPSFDKENDIGLLRGIKSTPQGILDVSTFPGATMVEPQDADWEPVLARCAGLDEDFETPLAEIKKRKQNILAEAMTTVTQPAISVTAWQSLLMGAILQMDERLAKLEGKLS